MDHREIVLVLPSKYISMDIFCRQRICSLTMVVSVSKAESVSPDLERGREQCIRCPKHRCITLATTLWRLASDVVFDYGRFLTPCS